MRLFKTGAPMLDLIYLLVTLVFFGLALGYVAACERMR